MVCNLTDDHHHSQTISKEWLIRYNLQFVLSTCTMSPY